MSYSLMLVGGYHVGWVGIRMVLRSWTECRIAGEVYGVQQAMTLAQSIVPDAILLAVDPLGGASIDLACQLRRCCPRAKIVLIGALASPDLHAALLPLDISAYLLWQDVRPESLPHLLSAIIGDDLRIASRGVVQQLSDLPRLRCGLPLVPAVSPREQRILCDMAAGLVQGQIAERQHLSERTVRRTVSTLEEHLDAPTTFVLGMRAAMLGYIS